MRNIAITVLMLILLVACSRETADYQATIVSQQGTMIAIMQPTRTPIFNLAKSPTPGPEHNTLDAVSTLVAVESDEAGKRINPSSSNLIDQDILQSMRQLIELQATALADSENRFKSQTKILYQDARMQATMIKQNRIVITAVIESQAQQNNLQATTISQNDRIITSNTTQERQNDRIINYNATAVSLSSTAISLAKVQNSFLYDINDELNSQTQLLRQICRNTAKTSIEYSECSR